MGHRPSSPSAAKRQSVPKPEEHPIKGHPEIRGSAMVNEKVMPHNCSPGNQERHKDTSAALLLLLKRSLKAVSLVVSLVER